MALRRRNSQVPFRRSIEGLIATAWLNFSHSFGVSAGSKSVLVTAWFMENIVFCWPFCVHDEFPTRMAQMKSVSAIVCSILKLTGDRYSAALLSLGRTDCWPLLLKHGFKRVPRSSFPHSSFPNSRFPSADSSSTSSILDSRHLDNKPTYF